MLENIDIKGRVRNFIANTLLHGEESTSLANTDSLLEVGVMDSLGMIDLLAFLEQEFGVEILDEEVVEGNFYSIATITAFISAKKSRSHENLSRTKSAELEN